MIQHHTMRRLIANRRTVHVVKYPGMLAHNLAPVVEEFETQEEAIKKAVYLDSLKPGIFCHIEAVPASSVALSALAERMAATSAKPGFVEAAKNMMVFHLTLKKRAI